jgi:hypothetical protein
VVPFLCFFLSGASGLVFEVIWTRMLTLVFGASTPAISTVLSAFMGGLALGSFIFGRFTDRLKFPILTYAAMEAGVGVLALVIPLVIRGVYPPFSHWVTNHGGNRFDVFTLLRFVVVALVLLPPPPSWAPPSRCSRATSCARAAASASAWAPSTPSTPSAPWPEPSSPASSSSPASGLSFTNAVAACTNLALAGLIVLFRKQLLGGAWPTSWRDLLPQREALPDEPAPADSLPDSAEARAEGPTRTTSSRRPPPPPPARGAPRRGGSGFAALAYEVILSRALDMVIGSSIYSFTIILMGFLIGIGGGSALASPSCARAPPPWPRSRSRAPSRPSRCSSSSSTRPASRGSSGSSPPWSCCSARPSPRPGGAPRWRWAMTQLLIASGAIVTYFFQDRIPRMFVYLALSTTTNCDAHETIRFSEHVGAIQWLSFVVALLCALPAASAWARPSPGRARLRHAPRQDRQGHQLGLHGEHRGLDPGSLLTGFVIMPWVGMETAMYIAVAVNLALALALLLASPGEEPVKYLLVPLCAVLLAVTTVGATLGREGRLARSRGTCGSSPARGTSPR